MEDYKDREFQEDELNCLINSIDLKADGFYPIYAASREPLRPLAKRFFVARIVIDIRLKPNVYELDGGEAHLETVYDEDAAPDAEARELTFDEGLMGTGIVRVYPVRGHQWTETEWNDIATLGRLYYIVYSRARLINHIHRSRYLDILTGLMNNAGIIEGSKALLKRGYAPEDFSAIFLNLKNFKIVNRNFGVKEGDKLLIHFAGAIYRCIDPEKECAARLGGDNFFILIRKERFARLRKKLENIRCKARSEKGNPVDVHLESRMGIYHCEKGDTISSIMQNAGIAFEIARRSAQDVVVFRKEMQERAMRQRWVTAVFPEAMERGEVVPYYQPKVHVSEKKLIGAEALVRWIRDGKPVSPGEFIPYLENDSLITRVDQYMLECVCRDLREWIDMGIEPVRISVNYSRRDFLEKTLAEDTLDILDKYGIEGKYIEIEVTETSFYEDFAALSAFTDKMHARGVSVSMDDFGTGYSSLSMFTNLDFDVVKLDKAFVDTLGNGDTKDAIVVESIAGMLTRLHTDIVAEGVETEAQVGRVRDLHCNIIQGYFFDRPLPRQEFQERLKKRIYA